MSNQEENGVAAYYSRIGSWAGYNLVMGRSQHAGYWTRQTKNEREAQMNYLQELNQLMDLKKGEAVLDAGSGQGYAARYFATHTGAHITGITITPREVKVSTKLSLHTPNAPNFVLGDYTKTDFADGQFEVVYTTETLSHTKDMKATMCEFYRILRPGGRLVLADYEIASTKFSSEDDEIADLLRQYAGGYGLRQQNPGQISAAMKEAGFVDIDEIDWSQYTKPTYDRLRKIARPLRWIHPQSRLAPVFVNAVMANYGYSHMYESGLFRYLIYTARKKS